MTSRYDGRDTAINASSIYSKMFENRMVPSIKQYRAPVLKYPSQEEMDDLILVPYSWQLGDKLYKVASEFYDDPSLWWVIAWFNKLPTEADIKIGFTIQIPTPIEQTLQALDAG